MTPLLIGMHDIEGAVWMKNNGIKGVCLMLETVQQDAKQLDFTAFANAGITVLLRIGFGYPTDHAGTIPPPKMLAAFENALVQTLNNARGVTAVHYGNEINNLLEAPGFDPGHPPGDHFFGLAPEYYIESYNRVWRKIGNEVNLGPAPIDPYFGPGSDNREWWKKILNGIEGARALFLHSKTQDNNPDNIRSDGHFADPPLTWQFLHFRTLETSLEVVPPRFKALPVYITEANPQRKNNNGDLGWEPGNARWVSECLAYVQELNSRAGQQAINGVVFYRWVNDAWALVDKKPIQNQIKDEARRLGLM